MLVVMGKLFEFRPLKPKSEPDVFPRDFSRAEEEPNLDPVLPDNPHARELLKRTFDEALETIEPDVPLRAELEEHADVLRSQLADTEAQLQEQQQQNRTDFEAGPDSSA